jgi:hypothetical protein
VLGIFKLGSWELFAWGWLWTMILLTSASWVAGITPVPAPIYLHNISAVHASTCLHIPWASARLISLWICLWCCDMWPTGTWKWHSHLPGAWDYFLRQLESLITLLVPIYLFFLFQFTANSAVQEAKDAWWEGRVLGVQYLLLKYAGKELQSKRAASSGCYFY